MSTQPNLLAQVRQHLISRGEDYQWVTMGSAGEKIGLAYLPVDTTGMPCTFMFTELQDPCSLVFDVHFGSRIAKEDRQELSMLLLTLNANLPEGQLLLDMEGGLVYYRLKYVVDDPDVSPETIRQRIEYMEAMGVRMSMTYARIIAQEFPTIY
ncbi:MAG: YbjN domain-containing protein [Akkermansia sp.]|nr:YbjN domain-containing protein [Akkermansia sp.]